MDYNDIADVLDNVAVYIDELETEKSAAVQGQRDERVAKLAAKYESATGEDMDDDTHSKLAKLDLDTLDQVLKVANNSNSDDVTSLGGPSTLKDRGAATSVKEAAANADDRFLGWLTS